jgi:hypothetical protein
MTRKHTPADFWPKVDKSGGPNACWPWLGVRMPQTATGSDDYGRFALAGRRVPAHRFAYEVAVGPIPEGLRVLHSCDNPPCCNPAHLSLGTDLDNMRDKIAKGRANWPYGTRSGAYTHPESRCKGDANGSRTHPERLPRGEAHPGHKVTVDQVREMRAQAHMPGVTQKALAKRFGLSQAGVWRILRRKVWRDI